MIKARSFFMLIKKRKNYCNDLVSRYNILKFIREVLSYDDNFNEKEACFMLIIFCFFKKKGGVFLIIMTFKIFIHHSVGMKI